MIKQWLLDILFPKFCASCKNEGDFLCSDCFNKIKVFSGYFCPVCGKRDFKPRKHPACAGKTFLKTLIVTTFYNDFLIREIIHAYKYNFIKPLAEPLSQLLIKSIEAPENGFSDFILIPIPLHPTRLKWRGFNQAELIAKKLSERYQITIETNALIRAKNTTPQVEVGEREKRIENIKNAFFCPNSDLVKDQKIILVDDVSSTGATLEEAAKTLKNSGAKEIWGMVIAK